jgi:hypothetical protein
MVQTEEKVGEHGNVNVILMCLQSSFSNHLPMADFAYCTAPLFREDIILSKWEATYRLDVATNGRNKLCFIACFCKPGPREFPSTLVPGRAKSVSDSGETVI